MWWWQRWRRLRERGILGMNRRNAACILDRNPRPLFPLVDGKRQMRELCRRIGVPTPEVFASVAAHSALRQLPRLLEGLSDFVLKPNRGAAGRGILVITSRSGGEFLRHNGERWTMEDIRQHASSTVSGLFSLGGRADELLIQQRVEPDPVLADVSYQGTADVRVIVYRTVPVMAMLRLPTRLSGGRANLHQGAVGAGIDLERGVTTSAVLHNHRTIAHPDTGRPVVGLGVPDWNRILEMARRVSQATGLGYLGVDVVLDRSRGPLLLEANARPGLSVQIANGQGLLPRLAQVDARLDGERPPLPEPGASVR